MVAARTIEGQVSVRPPTNEKGPHLAAETFPTFTEGDLTGLCR